MTAGEASMSGRRSVARVDPCAGFPALDSLVDEVDAASAVLRRREVGVEFAGFVARDSRRDRARRVAVDVREGLDEALRVPRGDARVVLRDRLEIIVTALVDLRWRIGGKHVE